MNHINEILQLPQMLTEQIKQVNEFQIDELIHAVIHRRNQLFPDQESAFLALPRDPAKRAAELENLIAFIRSVCDLSAHNE